MNPKVQALLDRTATPTLITSLRTLDAIDNPSAEERMARAWTIEALENRFPAASAAVEKAFDDAEQRMIMAGDDSDAAEVDYVAVLLANIPEVAA